MPKLPSQHTFPIEYSLASTPTGCIELDINVLGNRKAYIYGQNNEQQKMILQGCFDLTEQNELFSCYSQEKPVLENNKIRYSGPYAHNWTEFKNDCFIGQQYGKYFINTGKQNTKDGSPIRQLSESVPNTEMLKKGYQFAIDRLHGDHFEVWDKNGKWIGVANLDGSKNEKKIQAEVNPTKRVFND
jgi:hypothetical protein